MMLIIIKIYKNVIKNKKQKSASLLCNDVNLLCLSLLAILNVFFRGPKKNFAKVVLFCLKVKRL